MKTLVTPSILSADFGHLQQDVDSIERFSDWLQMDIMDGHFVPNISFGVPVVRSIKTKLPLDVHLMVTNPADRIEEFAALKAANITFHAEAVIESAARTTLIAGIRATGATAGIALNPETSLSAIDDVVAGIDLVLIMTVHPGFGGQTFIESTLQKVRALRARFPSLMIQVDGGIDTATAAKAREAGANNLVAGSAIFAATDREAVIRSIRG